MFELSTEAAIHNQWVLEQFDSDINNLIQAHPNSILSYSSEFRPSKALKPLLCYHPRWRKFQHLLDHGSSWPVTSIDDATRIAKNNELITRGNHASALTYSDILDASLAKEVKQG